MPLVSFCFTTFKRGNILKSTLESIKRQTFLDYEVIVSDNDPDCSGRSVVEEMQDERFKYFPNGANLGMKPSFNKSLERSNGEFIVMIADDDPVYHDMLETLVRLQKDYPGYGLYMGGSDWYCTDPKVAKLYKINVGTNSWLSNEHEVNFVQAFSPFDFLKRFFTFKIFSSYLWSTCMVKKEVLVQMGGVPDYGTPFLGDYAYLSLMGSHSGCVVINKSLGCQTIHLENFGRNQNEQIATAARNFPAYLSQRMSALPERENIKEYILSFVGLWVVSHLSFLHNYFKSEKVKADTLSQAEKEVFAINFMKKYRFKYELKKRSPALHDQLVLLKKRLKGKY
ncbi:glycosyltransferase family 2 protein [Segetibacter koreensis]|uniref:glycosyltransferase family 2 protein n=1 Tax=Segetibacter koreensis TaxID=398037 RepID=UPI0003768599|nr:glycosyltransferase family A protein [Segetibacter koreensis]